MATRRLLALFLLLPLAGCGAGSDSGPSARDLARQRTLATARMSRAVFATIGLLKRVTGRSTRTAAHSMLGARAALLAGRKGRAVEQGFDEDSGLYYVLNIADDRSGKEQLYSDAEHQSPAGEFQWPAPDWNGGVTDSYPAVYHMVYQITAGDLAGCHGTMDVTAQDAALQNGSIHLVLTNGLGETAVADFTITAGKMTGTQLVTIPGLGSYHENDSYDSGGNIAVSFTFDDGWSGLQNWYPDGSANQTITDAGGSEYNTGSIDDSGEIVIDYSDGSSETDNVTTDDSGDWKTRHARHAANRGARPTAVSH